MSDDKRNLVRDVRARQAAARKAVEAQWHRCFWTRPLGHIRDGTRDRHFFKVCLYCGKPDLVSFDDVRQLEEIAESAHRFPIANGIAKGSATA